MANILGEPGCLANTTEKFVSIAGKLRTLSQKGEGRKLTEAPSSAPHARDLFRIARVPLETRCHWLFYLIVVSGFQSAGRLNSLNIAPGVARCPATPYERVNDDVSKETLVWPRARDGRRHVGVCLGK